MNSPGLLKAASDNTKTTAPQKRLSNLRRESMLLAIFIALSSALAVYYDGFEALVEFTAEYEDYDLDEVLTVLICSSLFFLIYSIRRVRELRSEMRRREQVEQKLFKQAMTDELTELPNRRYFTELLQQQLSNAQHDKQNTAVYLIDISDFKMVNDIQGHSTGDRLLQSVANVLNDLISQPSHVARLGGNEFAFVQSARELDIQLSAQQVLDCFSKGFLLDGELKRLQTCVGVAISTPENQSAEELLRIANIALSNAKGSSKHCYALFTPQMDVKLRKRKRMEVALRDAIANNLLELHYQPIFACNSQQLLGFEALCRWTDDTLGSIGPDIFIDIAEETGLIEPLGRWVMREAIREAASWPKHLFISVNVSPKQFYRKSFVDSIRLALNEHQLDASRLEIEITENCLVLDPQLARNALFELKEMGVQSALDDFGMGYSSLSYLRNFSFDKLKIDRSFIQNLQHNQDDQSLVRAIVEMSASLGMITTAEGIEETQQLKILQDLNANQAQGFLLGRPQNSGITNRLIQSTSL